VFDQTDFLIDNNNLTGYSQTLLEIAHDSGMIQTRYEFGDDLYSQVRWGDATLPPPGEGEGGGEGVTSFFLYDGLGSTRSLTNASGAIVQSYNYRPFGEGIDHPGELSTNHLFTGEYYDSNLDYYYLRARYYSPGLGRFTGYDPVEDANNKLHKYVYCGNEPISNLDSSGQFLIGFLIAAFIFAAILSMMGCGSKPDRYVGPDPKWFIEQPSVRKAMKDAHMKTFLEGEEQGLEHGGGITICNAGDGEEKTAIANPWTPYSRYFCAPDDKFEVNDATYHTHPNDGHEANSQDFPSVKSSNNRRI